jgi:hypothetical protein
MTDEELDRLRNKSLETLERTAHIRPRVIADQPRIESRNQRDARAIAEQDKSFAAKRAAEQQENERKAAATRMSDQDIQDAINRAFYERWKSFADQFADDMGAEVARTENELSRKFREETKQLRDDIAMLRGLINGAVADARRERGLQQKQTEIMQQAHAREVAALTRQLGIVEKRIDSLGDDLFGGSAESFVDAFGEAWHRHQKRITAATIRRVA